MRKRDFAALVRGLGGTTAAALVFAVHPATVRRWVTGGVPKKRTAEVESIRASRQRARHPVKTARTNLVELLGLLKLERELPRSKPFAKVRDGRYTLGYERQEVFDTWLTPQVISEVKQTFSRWRIPDDVRYIATAKVSEFGPPAEARVAGYQAIIVPSLRHSKAAQFNAFAVHTSGVQATKAAAVGSLISELRELEATPGLVTFLHTIYFSSYRYKTQDEVTSHETAKRKARGYNKRPSGRTKMQYQ